MEVALSGEQPGALAASGVVTVAPGPRAGLWRLTPRDLVGTARLADVELHIRPKTPIARLLFLLGYARQPGRWHHEQVHAGESRDLVPALAYAFVRAADRALRKGVLQGYREIEEALPVVRGRIREADQLRLRYGLMLPVEVRYDDYTTDIAENQIVRAASERLLRLPDLPGDVRAGLRRILARLRGVSALTPGAPLPTWSATRLNARYRVALGLAELALRSTSYELDDGTEVRVDGLLVNVADVFEDFVTAAFDETLTAAYGGRCHPQDPRHSLDRARRIALRPDLVWDRPDDGGRLAPAAVIDAKYKTSTPNEDLYQMLAYCTALGLSRGHLVYAASEHPARQHRVRRADVEIVQHVIHLDRTPGEMLGEVTTVVDAIVG